MNFVLIPGPPVRSSSWGPTASVLRTQGCGVQIPDVLAFVDVPPPWRAWSTQLQRQIHNTPNMILVGHSSATALAADLSTRLPASGLIFVDGDIPPSAGPAAALRPALKDFVAGLADEKGQLPIWSRWHIGNPERAKRVGIDVLASTPTRLAEFEADLPTLPLAWFDDAIDLAPWTHIPVGYIQTSEIYDHTFDDAQSRGWPVARLRGTHLHPVLEPEETAGAIVGVAQRLLAAT